MKRKIVLFLFAVLLTIGIAIAMNVEINPSQDAYDKYESDALAEGSTVGSELESYIEEDYLQDISNSLMETCMIITVSEDKLRINNAIVALEKI